VLQQNSFDEALTNYSRLVCHGKKTKRPLMQSVSILFTDGGLIVKSGSDQDKTTSTPSALDYDDCAVASTKSK